MTHGRTERILTSGPIWTHGLLDPCAQRPRRVSGSRVGLIRAWPSAAGAVASMRRTEGHRVSSTVCRLRSWRSGWMQWGRARTRYRTRDPSVCFRFSRLRALHMIWDTFTQANWSLECLSNPNGQTTSHPQRLPRPEGVPTHDQWAQGLRARGTPGSSYGI